MSKCNFADDLFCNRNNVVYRPLLYAKFYSYKMKLLVFMLAALFGAFILGLAKWCFEQIANTSMLTHVKWKPKFVDIK